ncbi:hypothetical protein EVAR_74645_1 [Eumeta japonica]|uniref:Uncharacterized protein n=1 Tax=Eumeta variegata TaxID=151549 RepID=A0A4C1WB66_EUMVA|nr:hypothetical protein EVAR_74645_1 [Eumeta japonica]
MSVNIRVWGARGQGARPCGSALTAAAGSLHSTMQRRVVAYMLSNRTVRYGFSAATGGGRARVSVGTGGASATRIWVGESVVAHAYCLAHRMLIASYVARAAAPLSLTPRRLTI